MNLIQQSIQRTRDKLREFSRTKAVVTRQVKDERERKAALIEQITDEVCFHTGLRVENDTDLPLIMLHVEQILLDVRRRKAEEDEPHCDPDKWA
jgi:hypothetical protein